MNIPASLQALYRTFKCLLMISLLVLTSCTTISRSQQVNLPRNSAVAILPFANNTETVQADTRAASIVSDLLHIQHVHVMVYPESGDCKQLLECKNTSEKERQAIIWARKHNARFTITGSINEWRYKVGLDGEPSVSITLRIVDLQTKQVVWSAVGSKVGGSRSGLGDIAQNLIMEMLTNVHWQSL